MELNKKILTIILLIFFTFDLAVAGYILYNNYKSNKELKDSLSEIGNKKNTQNIGKEDSEGVVRTVMSDGFYYETLSEDLKKRITGKSYKENEIIDYSDLRHVVVKYIGFDKTEKNGELIVNVRIAEDVVCIFKELFDAGYEIEKIKLVDEYNANDDDSMADNNSSAFNFRFIDGTEIISDHGYGLAIDINPLYNPYVRSGFGNRDVLPVNGAIYADRERDFPHKIVKGDICYNTFIKYGFKWGGEWKDTIDYQHFYKEISD